MIWAIRVFLIYLLIGLAVYYWYRYTLRRLEKCQEILSTTKAFIRVLLFWPVQISYVVRRLK